MVKFLFISVLCLLGNRAFGQVPLDKDKSLVYYKGEKEITVKGNWKFFWQVFIKSEQTEQSPNSYKQIANPGIWNNIELDDQSLDSYGYATYSIDILSDNSYKNAGIEIPCFYSAYSLYLNDELIAKNGKIGKDAKTEEIEQRPQTKPINLHKGLNKLTIEISNHYHSKGGFFDVVQLGELEYLLNKRENRMMLFMTEIGGLVLIGVFMLGMYLFWKRDIVLFYYALYTLCFATRIAFSGLYPLARILDSIPGLVAVKIEYLSFYLTFHFLFLFVSILIPEEYTHYLRKIFLTCSFLVIIATLILPLSIYSRLITPYIYVGITVLIYGIYIAIRMLSSKGKGSFILMLGLLFIFSGLIWSGLIYLHWTPGVQYFNNILLLLSFFLMSLVIAKRIGITYQTIEKLQEKTMNQKETIEKLNQLQSKWFTNIAHELRTPLTLMLLPINKHIRDYQNNVSVDISSIKLAEANGTRLLSLVNDLLDISKLQSAGRIKVEKHEYRISLLIIETVSYFKTTAEQKGIELSYEIHSDLILNIDKRRIQSILINLISNALKFTDKGGSVKVDVTRTVSGDDVNIKIIDSGKGISTIDLPKVFERHFYTSVDPIEESESAGIGLALSKELAKLHDGNLFVESKINEGSTFTLTLPKALIVSTVSVQSEELVNTYSIRKSSTPRNLELLAAKTAEIPVILIVEDNADMRLCIHNMMPNQWEIIEAQDGSEALELLDCFVPDLILTDVMMPKVSGFELLNTVKSNDQWQDIPFIMLTALAGHEDKINALTLGVDEYIIKPFNEEELLVRIKHTLIKQNKRKEFTLGVKEEDKTIISTNRVFLNQLSKIVLMALTDADYSVTSLAEEMNLSERTLYRKVKSTIGLSPLQYIREVRLQKAKSLLEAHEKETIAEVMYAVGFRRSDYFAKIYRERFGKLPSEYSQKANI